MAHVYVSGDVPSYYVFVQPLGLLQVFQFGDRGRVYGTGNIALNSHEGTATVNAKNLNAFGYCEGPRIVINDVVVFPPQPQSEPERASPTYDNVDVKVDAAGNITDVQVNSSS